MFRLYEMPLDYIIAEERELQLKGKIYKCLSHIGSEQ